LRSPHHHGSHGGLITHVTAPSAGDCKVDAIFVPTARPADKLNAAIQLASKLGCPLVSLHSRRSEVDDAKRLAVEKSAEIVAVDFRTVPADVLPAFSTTSLLAGTPFERRTDTSSKRNLALLLARAVRWQHVVFLDDDIEIPTPEDLTDAVPLLHDFAGVGLTMGGYPDNSVVCHAHRKTGGLQDTFVGGGALAVNPVRGDSFFPEIYNEDWFFLLNNTRLSPVAKTTGIAMQQPYDPFANKQRARVEEFGDALAEGVFSLLDRGRRVQDANVEFWWKFLADRRSLIKGILRKSKNADISDAERDRMRAALDAAYEQSLQIAPELCVQYLKAWRTDLGRWRRYLELHDQHFAKTKPAGIDDALLMLGIAQPSEVTSTAHSSGVRFRVPSANQSDRVQVTRP
jgi:hypothetical protein